MELLKFVADAARNPRLKRDIADVDALIQGNLLSSRLDALTDPLVAEKDSISGIPG